MGYSPPPFIAPPARSREELFRREITPPRDYATPVLGWALTLSLAALVVVPILWAAT